jgi:hypothetical protein
VNISTSAADQPIAGVPCALQVLTKGGLQAPYSWRGYDKQCF